MNRKDLDDEWPLAEDRARPSHLGLLAHGHSTRTGALAKLDQASFSWFHVKAILISGTGFFTDAYDLFLVSLVVPMIGFARYPELHGQVPAAVDTTIKGVALLGTLAGQVWFGVWGDRVGRKAAYGTTLIIMIAATLLSVITSFGPNALMVSIFCCWRLVLGIGIGGDYPLSSVITSEYSNRGWRGAMIAAVFSMQGFGMLAAAGSVLLMLRVFRAAISECELDKPCTSLEYVWRICVALGAMPAAATYYLRKKLPETPRFTAHVQQDVELASRHVNSVMHGNDMHGDHRNKDGLRHAHHAADAAVLLVKQDEPADADVHDALLGNKHGAEGSSPRSNEKSESGRLQETRSELEDHPDFPHTIAMLPKKASAHSGTLLGSATHNNSHVKSSTQAAPGPQPITWSAFTGWCKQPRNLGTLVGCCACWFLLDVAFYSNGLFTPTVLQDIGFLPEVPPGTIYTKLHAMAAGQAMVALMGGIPGYWVAVALVEVVGRKPLQAVGFLLMTILLALLAGLQHVLETKVGPWAYITLFALNNFAANAGPNTTTFILSGEVFPTRFRTTCAGLSAAAGKAGAVLGAFAFGHLFAVHGTQVTVAVLSCFTALGVLFTALVPESKGRCLEELSGDADHM